MGHRAWKRHRTLTGPTAVPFGIKSSSPRRCFRCTLPPPTSTDASEKSSLIKVLYPRILVRALSQGPEEKIDRRRTHVGACRVDFMVSPITRRSDFCRKSESAGRSAHQRFQGCTCLRIDNLSSLRRVRAAAPRRTPWEPRSMHTCKSTAPPEN